MRPQKSGTLALCPSNTTPLRAFCPRGVLVYSVSLFLASIGEIAPARATNDQNRAIPRSPQLHAAERARRRARGDLAAVWDIISGSPINLLLVCVPLCFVAEYCAWGAVATFSLSFFALVPLALILGDVTEDLALR
jgi:Ca2+:H+ antiporter